ncbi:MAG: RING finger protein, partial [Candidatus Helarchaeota archaeon]
IWVDRRSRERPVATLGDLLSKSRSDKARVKGEPTIPKDLPPNYCPVCGSNVRNLKTCRKCGYDIVRCKICSKIIKLDDDIIECPYCGEQFHRDEFLEWLKIKAFCPNCRTEMDLWEFKRDDEEKVL